MGKRQKTVIDRFGRVLIPKGIRDELGLVPGTRLSIERRGTGIALCPIAEEPQLLHKGKVLIARVEPLQELTGLERKLRRERLSRVSGSAK